MNNIKTVQAPNDVRVLLVNWNEKPIGYLVKGNDGNYLYKYDQKGLQDARKLGYQYLIGFKDTRKTYASKELFPAFKSRIPTKQRRDLPNILASLGMESYDEFDLLASSEGRLLTDAISFKEFIPDNDKLKEKLSAQKNKKAIEEQGEIYGR